MSCIARLYKEAEFRVFDSRFGNQARSCKAALFTIPKALSTITEAGKMTLKEIGTNDIVRMGLYGGGMGYVICDYPVATIPIALAAVKEKNNHIRARFLVPTLMGTLCGFVESFAAAFFVELAITMAGPTQFSESADAPTYLDELAVEFHDQLRKVEKIFVRQLVDRRLKVSVLTDIVSEYLG